MKHLIFHTKPDNTGVRLTVAGVVDGNRLKIGVARCSSNDQFCKKKGAGIAEGRARAKNPITALELPEEYGIIKYFVDNAKQIADTYRKHPQLIQIWKKPQTVKSKTLTKEEIEEINQLVEELKKSQGPGDSLFVGGFFTKE